MSFKTQKAVFQEIIEETVGDVVNYDTVCQIQENLTELIEEHKEEPQPFKLQKSDVKSFFKIVESKKKSLKISSKSMRRLQEKMLSFRRQT